MKNMLKRNQIVSFFILAYAFTWSIFVGIGIVSDNPGSPFVILGIWGPTLMAILLSVLLSGGPGVRSLLSRFLIWRVGLQWYALLFFGFVTVELIAIGLWNLMGATPVGVSAPSVAALLQVLVFQLIIVGFGEEAGWRGFALPRLQQQLQPLKAASILALVHLFWHLPGFWMGVGFHNVPLVLGALWIIPFTIIFVWVYNNTRGSLLIAALYHALFGVTLSFVPILPSEELVPITPASLTSFDFGAQFGPYMVFVVLTWICAAAVVIMTQGTLSYAEHSTTLETPTAQVT